MVHVQCRRFFRHLNHMCPTKSAQHLNGVCAMLSVSCSLDWCMPTVEIIFEWCMKPDHDSNALFYTELLKNIAGVHKVCLCGNNQETKTINVFGV